MIYDIYDINYNFYNVFQNDFFDEIIECMFWYYFKKKAWI